MTPQHRGIWRQSADFRMGWRQKELEATGGIEPPNRGFANPCLNHLATSPPNSSLNTADATRNTGAHRDGYCVWCREWDSNPHALSSTTPST